MDDKDLGKVGVSFMTYSYILTLSLPTVRINSMICQAKPKGVTIQMKALDEYILMVLFVLFLIDSEESSFSCKRILKM